MAVYSMVNRMALIEKYGERMEAVICQVDPELIYISEKAKRGIINSFREVIDTNTLHGNNPRTIVFSKIHTGELAKCVIAWIDVNIPKHGTVVMEEPVVLMNTIREGLPDHTIKNLSRCTASITTDMCVLEGTDGSMSLYELTR